MFSKALKIILPACLDEITGWFRLFQSMGEIKAAFIYFLPFPALGRLGCFCRQTVSGAVRTGSRCKLTFGVSSLDMLAVS